VENILDRLVDKLKEERFYIVKAIESKDYIEKLQRVIGEKEALIKELSNMPEEFIKENREKIEEIQKLSRLNMSLAMENIQFIDEIFSAIFNDDTQKYNQNGYIQQEQKSLFNKKI